MMFAETFLDRKSFSTDNNEYAYGLNDENEWEENIVDRDVPLDEEIDDFLSDPDRDRDENLYNESGFDRERLS